MNLHLSLTAISICKSIVNGHSSTKHKKEHPFDLDFRIKKLLSSRTLILIHAHVTSPPKMWENNPQIDDDDIYHIKKLIRITISEKSFYFGDIFQGVLFGVMRIFRRTSYNGQSQIRWKIRWQICQNEIRRKIRLQNRRTKGELDISRTVWKIKSRFNNGLATLMLSGGIALMPMRTQPNRDIKCVWTAWLLRTTNDAESMIYSALEVHTIYVMHEIEDWVQFVFGNTLIRQSIRT